MHPKQSVSLQKLSNERQQNKVPPTTLTSTTIGNHSEIKHIFLLFLFLIFYLLVGCVVHRLTSRSSEESLSCWTCDLVTACWFTVIDSSNKSCLCCAPPTSWFLDQEVAHFQWSVALNSSFAPLPSSLSLRHPPAADPNMLGRLHLHTSLERSTGSD